MLAKPLEVVAMGYIAGRAMVRVVLKRGDAMGDAMAVLAM